MFYIGIYFPLLCHFEHLGESGSKGTVQKVKVDGPQSGQSRESGRSVQKWTILSQTGRSFEPKWAVQDDSGRSFEPKWTVMG